METTTIKRENNPDEMGLLINLRFLVGYKEVAVVTLGKDGADVFYDGSDLPDESHRWHNTATRDTDLMARAVLDEVGRHCNANFDAGYELVSEALQDALDGNDDNE